MILIVFLILGGWIEISEFLKSAKNFNVGVRNFVGLVSSKIDSRRNGGSTWFPYNLSTLKSGKVPNLPDFEKRLTSVALNVTTRREYQSTFVTNLQSKKHPKDLWMLNRLENHLQIGVIKLHSKKTCEKHLEALLQMEQIEVIAKPCLTMLSSVGRRLWRKCHIKKDLDGGMEGFLFEYKKLIKNEYIYIYIY